MNTCSHCSRATPDAYDTTGVKRVLYGPRRRPSIDDIYEILNALNRTYASARWCLAQGTGVSKISVKDQVLNYPSNVDSRHDLRTGLLITALREFYSVLDKVAAAMNSMFHLGHDPGTLYFRNVWAKSKKRDFPRSRDKIHSRLARFPSQAMSALYGLADSLEYGGGIYEGLRRLRHKLEHRIVVPMERARERPYYEIADLESLKDDALKIGRISRAAIIYLGAAVYFTEERRLRKALKGGESVMSRSGPSATRLPT